MKLTYNKARNGDSSNILRNLLTYSFVLKFICFGYYNCIIRQESVGLFNDIQKINLKLVQNSYTRFSSEFNILIQNSLDVTGLEAQKCLIVSSLQYFMDSTTDIPSIINKITSTSFKDDKSPLIISLNHFYFYFEKYKYYINSRIGLGPSLDTLLIHQFNNNFGSDLNYIQEYHHHLRGYHPNIQNMREEYTLDMNNIIYNIIPSQIQENSSAQLINSIQNSILNPSSLLCNSVINRGIIDFQNFQENFIAINGISIKDWTNHIFHPTYGAIATRLQNIIVKTIYTIIGAFLFFFITFFYKKFITCSSPSSSTIYSIENKKETNSKLT